MIRRKITLQEYWLLGSQQGGLTSHCQILYTLGVDVDERRKKMDKGRVGDNDI